LLLLSLFSFGLIGVDIFIFKAIKLIFEPIIDFLKLINFSFVISNGNEELTVSLFSVDEFIDNLLGISETRRSLDLLEGLLNRFILLHFSLHFSFQEVV